MKESKDIVDTFDYDINKTVEFEILKRYKYWPVLKLNEIIIKLRMVKLKKY